jgi:hypothetical protein
MGQAARVIDDLGESSLDVGPRRWPPGIESLPPVDNTTDDFLSPHGTMWIFARGVSQHRVR